MLLLLLGNANLGWEHFIPTVGLWVVIQNLQTEVDTCHQFCSWSLTLIMSTFGLARCHSGTQSLSEFGLIKGFLFRCILWSKYEHKSVKWCENGFNLIIHVSYVVKMFFGISHLVGLGIMWGWVTDRNWFKLICHLDIV